MASNKSLSHAPIPNKTQLEEAGANSILGKRARQAVDNIFDEQKASLGWSPFMVISPKESGQKLTSLSIIKVGKAMKQHGVSNIKEATRLRSGAYLIEVASKADSNCLKKMTTLCGIPVIVEAHKSLNTSKGVVKSWQLQGCTEEELVEELDGVLQARRIVLRRTGGDIQTNTWILTFDSPTPPSRLRITSFLEVEIKPFIPNPMRCFKCHRYGHTKQKCRREQICPRCGKKDHEESQCKTDELECPNCRGKHTAFSKDCQKWKEEKAILEYKAKYGGTFTQARAKLFPKISLPGKETFAQVVALSRSVPQETLPTSKEKSQLLSSKSLNAKAAPSTSGIAKTAPSTSGVVLRNRYAALENLGEAGVSAPSLMSLSLPPSMGPPSVIPSRVTSRPISYTHNDRGSSPSPSRKPPDPSPSYKPPTSPLSLPLPSSHDENEVEMDASQDLPLSPTKVKKKSPNKKK